MILADPLPQMEAEFVSVYIRGFLGMELQNSFGFGPKQILDLAHLIPCRAAVHARDADMLPIAAGTTADDLAGTIDEVAVIAL